MFDYGDVMAGGMHGRRGPGVPLRDRGPNVPSTAAPGPFTPVLRSRSRARHAWASLRPGVPEVEALVVSWQSTPDGWSAWVVCAVEDDQVVTLLLPASQLRPAT
jgi:hypothetical protein